VGYKRIKIKNRSTASTLLYGTGLFLFLITFWIAGAEARQLRVRGDYNYPPYEYIDENGQPAGYNVDVFTAVSRVMDLDAELLLEPWKKVRMDLETGEIDILIGMFQS
jgi:two-component system, cell cycle sensor histidine kinase and response regulator CckA